MELLKLSKFKLQLRALISELRECREKERHSSEQLQILAQKQKETNEIYGKKLAELQTELATSNDLRQKLETKLNYLQNDNELLDNKQKELQGTINRLLQSRECFVKAYEDSTYEMKQAIAHKDKKIAVLTEKINLHISLFSSIETEALSVKKVVNDAQKVLNEKEEVVAGLKMKVDKATTIGTEVVEKISKLEIELRRNEVELRTKERVILDLKAQLEAASISDNGQAEKEELKGTLLAKEAIIQGLISDKNALHLELSTLHVIIKKIQDTIRHMDEQRTEVPAVYGIFQFQDWMKQNHSKTHVMVSFHQYIILRLTFSYYITEIHNPLNKYMTFGASMFSLQEKSKEAFSSMLASQECAEDYVKGKNRSEDATENTSENCHQLSNCLAAQSAFSQPQSTTNIFSISFAETKDNCRTLVDQPDSECSTTQPHITI